MRKLGLGMPFPQDRNVALCWRDESDAVGAVSNELHFIPSPPADDRLEPSQWRRFVLPVSLKVEETPAGEPDPKYWVVVRSTKGELYRDDGSHIYDAVKYCADAQMRRSSQSPDTREE